jgi:hypothetical protein
MSEEIIVSAEIKDRHGGQERKYHFARQPPPLGAGATAIVYRGVEVSDPSHQVAIKIARAGSTKEDLEQFWEELDFLQKLYQEPLSHVPWAAVGMVEGEPGRAVIVMELIPEQHELRRQTEEGVLDEKVAVEAGYQYAELLTLMHEQDIVSRGDRKAADLRWIVNQYVPAERRLVVLDWNRARQYKPDDPELAGYRFQDLRVFGRLWVEHSLGRNVDNLPDVEDTTDEHWSKLTRSFRVILTNSLYAGPGRGYQNGNDLLRALEVHRHRRVSTREEILTEAILLRETSNGEWGTPVAPANPAEEMRVLLDWARRKGAAEYDLSDLEQWAKRMATEPGLRAEKAVKEIDNLFGLYEFPGAVQVAEKAVSELSSLGVPAAPARLRVCRWRVAAAALKEIEKDPNLDKYVRHLRTAVTELERATDDQASPETIQNAMKRSDDALNRIAGQELPMQKLVNLLRCELEIHKHLHQGPPVNAKSLWERCWQPINANDSDYADSLLGTFPALARAIVTAKVETNWEKHKTEFDEAVGKLFSLLAPAVDSLRLAPPRSTSLNDSLETAIKRAHGLWKELSARTHFEREREQLEKKYGVVLSTDDLWEAVKRNQFARALTCLVASQNNAAPRVSTPETPRNFKLPPEFERFKEVLQAVAYQRAKEIADKARNVEPRWPDELKEAQYIMEQLRETGFSLDRSAQETDWQLREWEANLMDLRERLQWQEDEELPRFYRRMIETSTAPAEADKITVALQEALEKGIEVVDREKTSEEIIAAYSVGTLLTLRTLRQVPEQITKLADRFEEKRPQLDHLVEETSRAIAKFHSRYQNFQKDHGLIENMKQQLGELDENFDRAVVVLFANTITAGLEAVYKLNYQEAKSCLQSARQLSDKPARSSQITLNLRLLQDAIQWLGNLEQDQKAKAIVGEFISKLRTNDLTGAETIRAQLYQLDPEITSGWLIKQLYDEHGRRKASLQHLNQQKAKKLALEEKQMAPDTWRGQQEAEKLHKEWKEKIQVNNLAHYIKVEKRSLDSLIDETDELIKGAEGNTTAAGSLKDIIPPQVFAWAKKPEHWLDMSPEEQKRVLKIICLEQKLVWLHGEDKGKEPAYAGGT